MTTPSTPLPTGVDGVLATLLDEPGRPRLTWYATDGERIELSGAVLVNWVTKTTNLLVEEFDAAPHVRVGLDLPPHWRSAVWALAAWRAGACLVLDPDTPVEVQVTSRPQRPVPGNADVVAVALPGLARSYPGVLPPGALDAAAAVMTYGDVLGPIARTVDEAPALVGRDAAEERTSLSHAELVDAALRAWCDPARSRSVRSRVLVAARPPLDRTLLTLLGTWALDGSVVLAEPDLLAADARRSRLIGEEMIDVCLD